ncbi:fungal-specific transcription factor domain-containing protein [Mycena galericulata]|nr:fungal-specific transcription factor domain-containing protein [Mycena galericulata]
MPDFRGAPGPIQGSKRRRMKGSCDICKQRKTRCDSSQMPGGRCSNCIAFNSECTHNIQPTVRRAGSLKISSTNSPKFPNSDSEVTAEAHVAAITSQSSAYISDADLRQVLLDVARYARSLQHELASLRRSLSLSVSETSSPRDDIKEEPASEELELFVNGTLAERFERFVLDTSRNRFFGRSSYVELIKTAMEDKKNVTAGIPISPLHPPTRRHQFWLSPWEHDDLTIKDPILPLIFPDPDLLQSLVKLYFTHVNILLCLLHRPTFEKSLAAGLHLVNRQFGSTVLVVCAVAAKYSDDPRVLLEGTNSRLSSGWKYIRQVQLVRPSLLKPASLYETQLLCLCVLYLQGSSAPDGCWILGGLGMRYVQDVGVNRRNRYDDKALNEQWTRVFWFLVCIDTLGSVITGRPRATSDTDYDVDYPIECDDEYWENPDPDMAFKQPPGKPSTLSFTVAYSKLLEILGMSQKTIYSVRKENKPEGWAQSVVAEIDAALDAWVDAIPDHLRWDPHMEHPVFGPQSAVLYASYYHVQIQVHRIFMTSPTPNAVPGNYPSLAICANSARSCSHIMDVAFRKGFMCTPHTLSAIADSGVVLLLNVWGGRRVGLATDPQKCLQDVETCLRLLQMYELRWQVAGRHHDIITELMRATKMDRKFVPNPLKRGLEVDENPEPSGEDEIDDGPGPNQNFGVHTVPLAQPGWSSGLSVADINPLFTLPKYTEDLGRLPVYEPFRWMKDSQEPEPQSETIYHPAAHVDHGSNVERETTEGSNYSWNEWGRYINNITNMEELVHALDNRAPI